MADRIGIINKGELILVEEKTTLMQKLGKRQLTLHLQEPMTALPAELAAWPLALKARRQRAGVHLRRPRRERVGHPVAAAAASASSGSGSRI